MTSFNDIPMSDIDYLLKINNINLSGDKYLSAWNFILTNPNAKIPITIADWIIAYNLIQKNINIPLTTYFDIITSKNKLLDLPFDRIINVMKYLHKLDETTHFNNLPNEIIVKIMSKLDCEQILSLCKLSKRFELICKENKNIFNEYFIKEGYSINDYNTKIMCKALKINERVCSIYKHSNIEINVIINFNGDVVTSIINNDNKTTKNKLLKGIKNVIGVTYTGSTLLLLDSKGKVYTTKTTASSHQDFSKRVKLFNSPQLLSTFKDVIQVLTDQNYIYALDVNGNVYNGDNLIFQNIKKMFRGGGFILFLNKDGECYKINDYTKNITAFTDHHNIKDIFTEPQNTRVITYDDIIYFYGGINDGRMVNLSDIKNIKKIIPGDKIIFILTKDDKLYFSGVNFDDKPEILKTGVKDIIKSSSNGTLVLFENDNIIYYPYDFNSFVEGYIGPNTKLLPMNNVLIDEKIYHVNIVGKKFDVEEISI